MNNSSTTKAVPVKPKGPKPETIRPVPALQETNFHRTHEAELTEVDGGGRGGREEQEEQRQAQPHHGAGH